jgi:hypothetical protein
VAESNCYRDYFSYCSNLGTFYWDCGFAVCLLLLVVRDNGQTNRRLIYGMVASAVMFVFSVAVHIPFNSDNTTKEIPTTYESTSSTTDNGFDEAFSNATSETEPSSTSETKEASVNHFNSNTSIKKYIQDNDANGTKIIDVNGTYVGDTYTVVITLDAESNGMLSAKNDVWSVLKALKDAPLDKFKEINISVKANMSDGSKAYAIKSAFSTGPIKSGNIGTPSSVKEHANSWWAVQ